MVCGGQCYVTVTMLQRLSVLCPHVIVTDYYVLIGEIACNKEGGGVLVEFHGGFF